jgi:hypothetical protein
VAGGGGRREEGGRRASWLGFGKSGAGLCMPVNLGQLGQSGFWARASTRATSCRLISCRARPALWAEVAAQHSPTSCSCRPRPEIIVLGPCSCRAKNSCFGPAHGPRAFWPSISLSTQQSLSFCLLRHFSRSSKVCRFIYYLFVQYIVNHQTKILV